MTRTKCSTFHNYKDVLACNLVSWFSVRLLDMEDEKTPEVDSFGVLIDLSEQFKLLLA